MPPVFTADDVLSFWFGTLDGAGQVAPETTARWWKKDAALDREIATRFGALHAHLLSGARQPWMDEPTGLLAAVVVLDQFSRNMFRGTAAMFAADERALALAFEGIALGHDRAVPAACRAFFYLPLMHSERLPVQERCVRLYAQLSAEQGDPVDPSAPSYAERHRDIVRRFGRFPHRNAALGRTSTGEELEFLAQPGSSF